MRRLLLIGLCGLLLAALGTAAWYALAPAPPVPTASQSSDPGFTITRYDRKMGNAKAPVVLIEYAAPICPHCAEFDMQYFPILKSDYIDSGKVFYVFRVFPLRPDDGPAEKLARCMPEDRYFDFIDLLFRNQPKWDGVEYPVADDHAGLLFVARIAGMSPEQADKCMNDTSLDNAINQVSQDGLQKYNLTGTPTFVVDGTAGQAGEPWPSLQRRLDAALHAKPATR